MKTALNNCYYLLITIACLIISQESFAQDCPQITFQTPLELPLNENELSLLCPLSSEGRESIPHYQAKFYLRGFLQARGHLKPQFHEKATVLSVSPNEKSFLEKVEAQDSELKNHILRFYQDSVVTPLLLNKIEEFVIQYYREKGHPCPQVETTYSPQKSLLKVQTNDLKQKRFGEVSYEAVPGLHPNFIKRFEAFKAQHPYNPQKLELTKKRIFRSGVVQNSYYQKKCNQIQEDFNIKQSFVPGPPRVLRFGVGANTEVGPMARIRWSHQRYENMGSKLQANIQASLKEQGLTLASDIYLWEESPRRSWKSKFKVNRITESDYEETSSRLLQKIKWTSDDQNFHYIWQTGPVLEASWFKTDVNKSQRSLVTPSWQTDLKIQDHDYELYDLFPQKGHQLIVSTDLRPTWLNNDFDIYRFDFRSVKLKPLLNWGRGDLVAGARFDFHSTWISDDNEISSVPPSLRFYGGGEGGNRGQRLNSLPKNNGLGALTHALFRLELRRTHAFIQELELLVFSDFSKFSEKPWRLDETLWASPGLGARWLSPIGPVQAYAARSLKYNPHADDGFYFYIGLGGEL